MSIYLKEKLERVLNRYLDATNEPFKGHDLADFIRNEIPNEIRKLPFITDDFRVTASCGMGHWAYVPWIAVMHKDVTTSTQRGYYVVYLFREDMNELYLTLAQGVTETPREEREQIKREMRTIIQADSRFAKDDNIYLGNSNRAKEYAYSTAIYIKYEKDQLPDNDVLIRDLANMVQYYKQFIQYKNGQTVNFHQSNKQEKNNSLVTLSGQEFISHVNKYIRSKGYYYEDSQIKNLFLSLKTKPFVILSGISGTGKTKIVQLFAESIGATRENGQFALIPVRPDWSDGSDLIGYVDLKGDFQPGPLTKILQEANKKENQNKPYIILLDEMNLARVEYYFSDLLSIMETKKYKDGKIVSDPVLENNDVGTLILPNNVYIIGTVNMDETTHPFSKKVLDRANTIEYNEVQLEYFDFLHETEDVEQIHIANEQLAGKYLTLKDAYYEHQQLIHEVTLHLVKMNDILKEIQGQFGYRVRDEICFYMIYNEEYQLMVRNEAFDYQILQKILPRITGNDPATAKVLKKLFEFCSGYRWEDNLDLDIVLNDAPYPRSTRKLYMMINKLEMEGFTSYWLG